MVLSCLALFLLAFAVSATATPLAAYVARRTGFVDRPQAHKFHRAPTPLLGGVALYLGAVAPVAGGLLVARTSLYRWLPGFVRDVVNLDAVASSAGELMALLLGATALAVVGLVDDRRPIRPRTKLLAQSLAGAVVVAGGTVATIYIQNWALQAALTVGWIVVVSNALNLMDNMDGLCAGICLIIALTLLCGAVQTDQPHVALLLACIAGSVAGFLLYNFPPAKIFMGDCGSLFLGYMLAVATILFTYVPPQAEPVSPFYPIVLPFLILAVPIFDAAVVVAIRFHIGQPIFQGDKRHLSHRLVALGMTHREAVLCVYVITLCVAMSAILLYYVQSVSTLGVAIILAQALGFLSLIVFMEQAGRRSAATASGSARGREP